MIYTIIDIETTGLNKCYDDILSVGFIRINSKMEILESDTLYFYKPDFQVEKYPACTVHKLKRNFLEQYKDDFKDNLKKLYSICYMSTLIGKNSTNFDLPFIKEFVRKHCPLLDLRYNATFDIQTEFSTIYQQRTGSSKRGTLTDYCNCLGITTEKINEVYNSLPTKDSQSMHMHGALYDCVATYLVFKEVVKIKNLNP